MSENLVQEIIKKAAGDSSYTALGKALEAGHGFIAENPELRFTFALHANGALKEHAAHNISAQRLLDHMDQACGGFSLSMANKLVRPVQDLAVASGRSVTRQNRHGIQRVNIAPAPKNAR